MGKTELFIQWLPSTSNPVGMRSLCTVKFAIELNHITNDLFNVDFKVSTASQVFRLCGRQDTVPTLKSPSLIEGGDG